MAVRRRRIAVGVAVLLTLTVGVVIGFEVPPAASTAGLPATIAYQGTAYRRAALVTTRTSTDGPPTVEVPATSGSIIVVSTCRLAVLHTSRARNALTIELSPAMRAGGDIPDTHGADGFVCPDAAGPSTHALDPAWLPRDGDRVRLTWRVADTWADAPSASAASWALAVYVPAADG